MSESLWNFFKIIVFLTKWTIYTALGLFLFLAITQAVETFGIDASNKFTSMFTPLIVAIITYILTTRQHDIADAQREVAVQQASIAAINKDIASNKLRIELFDRRYEIYLKISSTIDLICSNHSKIYSFTNDFLYGQSISESSSFFKNKYQEIMDIKNDNNKNLRELEEYLDRIKFFFNEDAKKKCAEMISNSYKYLSKIYPRAGSEYTIFIDDYDNHYNSAKQSYADLSLIMTKYMDMSKIL